MLWISQTLWCWDLIEMWVIHVCICQNHWNCGYWSECFAFLINGIWLLHFWSRPLDALSLAHEPKLLALPWLLYSFGEFASGLKISISFSVNSALGEKWIFKKLKPSGICWHLCGLLNWIHGSQYLKWELLSNML